MSAEVAAKYGVQYQETKPHERSEVPELDPSVYQRFKAMVVVVAFYMGIIAAFGKLTGLWAP